MQPIAFIRLFAVTLVLSVATGLGQDSYKVESVEASTVADFPKVVLEKVDPQGSRVVGSAGAVCEVWLRKPMPTTQDSGALGVLFGTLENGAFLGVLRLPMEGADFRGQPIKPGFYTMRYALIPQDGAHMGVYQTRDSIVLCPIGADTDLEKNLSFDGMVELSRDISGTPHPAFLVMAPVTDTQDLPSVIKDDMGYWNLQLKLQGQEGDVPIGITVVGKWEGV